MILTVLLMLERTNAQPTLTAATNNPTAGQIFTQHQTFYEAPGAAGANITWDFSGILTLQSITNTFLTTSATPYASTFPTANLASNVDDGSTPYFAYYLVNSNNFSIAGMYIPSMAIAIPYSDVENLLQYPITYNTSYTDNFACTLTGNDRHGHVDVVADGYGTLIMPYGTVTNVLRVKASETYADYISGVPVANYTSINYYWYKPGIHNNILQISTLNMNGNLYNQYGLYIDGTNVGINESTLGQSNFSCYPIPATNKITIEIQQQKHVNESTITICNINGEEIIKQQISLTSNKSEIDISALSSGVYFVKLVTDKTVEIKKIIKQ